MAKQAVEFRGIDNLVYALVIEDSDANYTTGAVKDLAPIAEVSKTINQDSVVNYYDNKAAITIRAEGSDDITVTVAVIDLETLADITGQTVDPATGALFEGGDISDRYLAVGYRMKKTDGTYSYIWKYKVSCSIPEEASSTENAGTDTNNQSIVMTCISTVHKFAKGGRIKGMRVDESDGKADLTGFFDTVTTPDTLKSAI
jgi:phi13 family phage major tail protein